MTMPFLGCYFLILVTWIIETLAYQWEETGAGINMCTKYEVSTLTHYKYMKCDEKCKNQGGLAGYESPKVIGNITI